MNFNIFSVSVYVTEIWKRQQKKSKHRIMQDVKIVKFFKKKKKKKKLSICINYSMIRKYNSIYRLICNTENKTQSLKYEQSILWKLFTDLSKSIWWKMTQNLASVKKATKITNNQISRIHIYLNSHIFKKLP